MKHVLCYGDSNTWGYVAADESRYGPEVRWPRVMENLLGPGWRVVEEGLNGRTTCLDDPIMPDRNGYKQFYAVMESHYPLDVVVIMLGCNDMKRYFGSNAFVCACGVEMMVETLRAGAYGPGGGQPQVLVVSPILIEEGIKDTMPGEFDAGSAKESRNMAAEMEAMAKRNGCHFFDAAGVAKPDPADWLHLDAAGHAALAKALADVVKTLA